MYIYIDIYINICVYVYQLQTRIGYSRYTIDDYMAIIVYEYSCYSYYINVILLLLKWPI